MEQVIPDEVKAIASTREGTLQLPPATLVGNQVDLGASFPEEPEIVVW